MVDEEEKVVQEEEQESVTEREEGSVSFSSGGRKGDFWDLLKETVVKRKR